jgi:hypothetical protein
MSNILQLLQDDFSVKKSKMRSLKVEELGFEIYCTPLTLRQKDAILAKTKKVDSQLSLYVYALIECALDADGNNVFSGKDKPVLMNEVDSDIVLRMGNFVLGTDEDSIEEDTEKNG